MQQFCWGVFVNRAEGYWVCNPLGISLEWLYNSGGKYLPSAVTGCYPRVLYVSLKILKSFELLWIVLEYFKKVGDGKPRINRAIRNYSDIFQTTSKTRNLHSGSRGWRFESAQAYHIKPVIMRLHRLYSSLTNSDRLSYLCPGEIK